MPTLRKRHDETVYEALERERRRHEDEAAKLRARASQVRAEGVIDAQKRLLKGFRDAGQLELQANERDREAEIAKRQSLCLAEADELAELARARDAAVEAARERRGILVSRAAELAPQLQEVQEQLEVRQREVEEMTDRGLLDDAASLERELSSERTAGEAMAAELDHVRAEADQLTRTASDAAAEAAGLRQRADELRAEARRAREVVANETRRDEEKRERNEERRGHLVETPDPLEDIVPLGGGYFRNTKKGLDFRLN